jgi:hypothetical protein
MSFIGQSSPPLSPTRATALASPLPAFAGWELAVRCPICMVVRTVLVDDLVAHRGRAILLGDVVAWLRCRACGTAPDWVKLANGTPGTADGPVREILIVGQSRP